MFIYNLSSEQQSVFLGLAKQLIATDGTEALEETALLGKIKDQMAPEVVPAEAVLNHLRTVYPCRRSRTSMMLELLGLAHADQDYHPAEKRFVNEVAAASGISELELRDMESWVVRQLALVREAGQFMED